MESLWTLGSVRGVSHFIVAVFFAFGFVGARFFLDRFIFHRLAIWLSSGGNTQLTNWMNMVRREKAIYDTLNMLNFDVTKKCLVGEGWFPVFAKTKIQEALQRATFDSSSQVGVIFHMMDSTDSPPTYFRTNHLTNAYQEIVDAYGVAKYQEANPAVYTIVTFPFLFAVMFGDWGHGICLLLGALFLIAREKKYGSQKLGSFMEMLFGGLIYNVFFRFLFTYLVTLPTNAETLLAVMLLLLVMVVWPLRILIVCLV